MIPLDLDTVYHIDLTDMVQFGPIQKQAIYARMTDGRFSGLLSEDLANALYSNITKSPTESSAYDLMDDNGNRYECRTISDKGANLIPSNQIGSGRKFNEAKHAQRQESLYAYLFIDIRHSPRFKLIAVATEMLKGKRRITSRQFDMLIRDRVTNVQIKS